ncbi:MAG: hypothetical protein LBT46_09055 [Planctomycetaceae bacterium]|jgi:hypothetical protein|nr:hypothetical protein [Planctomycetaceae bacterium]
MSLNVVCPGCLKRFQVSDRFAGQKGPCPVCKTVIQIPKAPVKIQGLQGVGYGGTKADRPFLKPLERIVPDFDVQNASWYAVAAFCIFLAAFFVGCISMPQGVRSGIAFFGLILLAFPLSLFGFQVMRNKEQLFIYTGWDLYRRTGIAALGYVLLWLIFEYFLQYSNAFGVISVLYFAVFACFGMFMTALILDIPPGNALMHFFVFAVPVVLLRCTSGLDWFWIILPKVPTGPLPPVWD